MDIRIATPDDKAAIVRHRRAMFEELGYGSPALLEKMVETFDAWIGDQLKAGGFRGWVAVDDQDEVIGSAGLRIRGWGPRARELAGKQGYVVGVYVDPAGRGQGAGRSLMQTMMDWCAEYQLDCLILHPSEKACDLYLSMGFVPEDDAYVWYPQQ
ncbi:MAG: GNAT family N-acetyltransferase [Anaerolineae bacterium]|nr:GNAT family N-acetyltransferase [Anaerolineae bacterium]